MPTHTTTKRSIICFNMALIIFMFLFAAFKRDFLESSGINNTVLWSIQGLHVCVKGIISVFCDCSVACESKQQTIKVHFSCDYSQRSCFKLVRYVKYLLIIVDSDSVAAHTFIWSLLPNLQVCALANIINLLFCFQPRRTLQFHVQLYLESFYFPSHASFFFSFTVPSARKAEFEGKVKSYKSTLYATCIGRTDEVSVCSQTRAGLAALPAT